MILPLRILLIIVILTLPSRGLYSHTEGEHGGREIAIDEKLGQMIPLDSTFYDENGNPVSLRQLIRLPVLLAPVYFHCPDVCSLLLSRLAETLNNLPSEPGKDYQVLAVSFDETEKPDLARERKKIYLAMMQRSFPEEAWRFLTGDRENILSLTDSVGFHFRREGKDFLHPVSLIVLSPEGKITRYLYGADPLPMDLRMALLEAAEGRSGPTIGKVLRFCFSYDPKGRRYVFNTLKVTGVVTLSFAASFMAFLLLRGKRRISKKKK